MLLNSSYRSYKEDYLSKTKQHQHIIDDLLERLAIESWKNVVSKCWNKECTFTKGLDLLICLAQNCVTQDVLNTDTVNNKKDQWKINSEDLFTNGLEEVSNEFTDISSTDKIKYDELREVLNETPKNGNSRRLLLQKSKRRMILINSKCINEVCGGMGGSRREICKLQMCSGER